MTDIKIAALGGVRENGKNMYMVDVDDAIFILDCGLVYPEDEMLGIDAVIPDFSYLEEQAERIAGVFLTHGHDDALGALPYLLQNMDVPVFGTKLTIELAKLAVREQGLVKRTQNFHVIDEETEIEFDAVDVSFFKTTHSVPDSVGIVLKTSEGSIVYTGDFQFDQSASAMYQTDYARLVAIGQQGVLALLSDSSNADTPFETDSQKKVEEDLLDTFSNATGRVIVSCVASNILRIQQILDAAYQANRTVFVTGRAVGEIINVAIKLKKLVLPDKRILGKLSELKKMDDHKVIVLETGQHGEPITELQRMSTGRHPQVTLKTGDLVYIATTPVSAMETTVARTKDFIYRAGASVRSMSDNVHVSGHASPNDLKLMMNLLKPMYVIPVAGEYRMMMKNAELATEVGIPKDHTLLLKKGDVAHCSKRNLNVLSSIPTGNKLIDGSGVGDIGNIVLRDRKVLSEDGILVAVLTISRRLGTILSQPQILSKGFVYMRHATDLLEESSQLVKDVVQAHLDQPEFEWGRLRQEVREELSQFLFDKTKRRPVVLPVIMEASSYRLEDEK